jgi:8-oxo-dGTP pyrophosphatase MutT (NUDIX family)
LEVLDYVFRAITPPGDVRRFHARFFIADARHATGELKGSGELVDLQWIPIDEAIAMPNTPGITTHVLEEVRGLLEKTDPMDLPAAHSVPVYHRRHGRDRVDHD